MIRYICDVCHKEKKDTVNVQPVFETSLIGKAIPGVVAIPEKVRIRIMRSVRGTWNGGVLCDKCLVKALQSVINQLNAVEEEEIKK